MDRFILKTERLLIRRFILDDAPFILKLLNTPNWIKYIGDKKVNTLKEAEAYLLNGPLKAYSESNFGLIGLTLKDSNQLIGTAGFLKRDFLDHPDIGFAILPEYYRQGLTFEAVNAILQYGQFNLGITTVNAITNLENQASIDLLYKLNFSLIKTIKRDDQVINLFQLNL